VAPRARARFLTAWLLVGALSASIAGCRASDPSDAISAAWTVEPSPPAAGQALVVRVTLSDRDRPVSGAKLRLEGQMSHPGMTPVVSDLVERGNGTYEGHLQLTMAGDWILVVTGELAGGERLTKQLDMPGVPPAG
jgi:hypothetical protein